MPVDFHFLSAWLSDFRDSPQVLPCTGDTVDISEVEALFLAKNFKGCLRKAIECFGRSEGDAALQIRSLAVALQCLFELGDWAAARQLIPRVYGSPLEAPEELMLLHLRLLAHHGARARAIDLFWQWWASFLSKPGASVPQAVPALSPSQMALLQQCLLGGVLDPTEAEVFILQLLRSGQGDSTACLFFEVRRACWLPLPNPRTFDSRRIPPSSRALREAREDIAHSQTCPP
eukprot:RCo043907